MPSKTDPEKQAFLSLLVNVYHATVRDRAKRDRERKATNKRRKETTRSLPVLPTDTSTPKRTSELKLSKIDQISLPPNSPSHSKIHLLDTYSLEPAAGEWVGSSRWPLYHTPTGRLTGFLRERQRLCGVRERQRPRKPPWKPPYTSPSCAPVTVHRAEQQNIISCKVAKREIAVENKVADEKKEEGDEEEEDKEEEEKNESDDTYSTSWSDASEDEDRTQDRGEREERDGALHTSSRGCSVRQILLEGAEMRQKAFALKER